MAPHSDNQGIRPRPKLRSIWRLFRRKAKEKRSLRYRVMRALIVTFVIAATLATALVLTRESLIRLLIKPRLEALLGVEMSATGFRAGVGGRVSLDNVIFRAPGIDGPAGVILEADELTANLQFGRLLRGAGADAIKGLIAVNPTFRISQSLADGSLNIDPIIRTTSAMSGGGGGATSLPEMQIVEGVVEFAEHQGEWFNVLARIRADGLLEAPDPGSPMYVIDLVELLDDEQRAAGRTPLALTGEIDLTTQHASLLARNVDLAAWAPEATPSNVRSVWSRLELAGVAPSARLDYDPDLGVSATLELRDVSLSMPTPAALLTQDLQGQTPERMRMYSVDGSMTIHPDGMEAELNGVVLETPVAISFASSGIELTAPFDLRARLQPFYFRETEGLGPFAPVEVREVLEMLSSPRATLSGEVHVFRESPSASPAEGITADGLFNLEDGAIAYIDFPYPVQDISGQIAFTLDQIELLNLHGFGPSGAVVTTSGVIAPLTDFAGVDLDIRAVDLPVDQVLFYALPGDWREMINELMDEESYQRLRRAGVVQSSDERADVAARIAALSRTRIDESDTLLRGQIERLGADLRRPVFAPGGTARADIRLHREPGRGAPYNQTVRVQMERASLLPRALPFPLVVDNLLLDVADEQVHVEAGGLRGLSGGIGRAVVDFNAADERGADAIIADATLRDLPLDNTLIATLELMLEDDSPVPGWLRDLGVDGRVDLEVDVAPAEDEGRLANISADVRRLSAQPASMDDPLLAGAEAQVRLRNDEFTLTVSEGRLAGAPIDLDIEGSLDPDIPSSLRLNASRVPLGAPLESFIEPFAPDAASAVRTLRAEKQPSGWLDVLVEGEIRGDDAAVDVTLSNLQNVAINTLDGRVEVRRSLGRIEIASGEFVASLRNLGADLWFNGAPGGRIVANGRYALDDESASALNVRIERSDLASPLLRALLRSEAPAAADVMQQLSASGRIVGVARAAQQAGQPWQVDGWVRPETIGMRLDGETIDSERVSGLVRFSNEGGVVDNVSIADDGWSLELTGAWSAAENTPVDLNIAMTAMGWPDEVRALVPDEVRKALDALDLRIDGPWELRNAKLSLRDTEGEGAEGSFTGELRFFDSAFGAGIPVTEAIGVVDMNVAWTGSAGLPQMQFDVFLESFKGWNLPLRNGRARIESLTGQRSVRISNFSADLADGRVAGVIDIDLPTPETGRYAADLRVAGIDLALLLAYLAGEEFPTVDPGERGFVSGDLSIVGQLGDRASRVGRGLLIAETGNLMAMPLLLPVLELANLKVGGGELDFGFIEFSLEGNDLLVNRIVAETNAIALSGSGSIRLPGGELDLLFTTRAKRRAPVIGPILDLLGAIRNQLVAAQVTGTLKEPRFRPAPLPATRGLFGDRFGYAERIGRRHAAQGGPEDDDAPVVRLQR